jgi:hypothetical protein
MSKRLWRVTVALTALVTAACPYDNLLTSNRGIVISGGGGGGTGPDALFFLVQPNDATAGNIITPAVQIEVLDSLRRPDTAYTNSITMTFAVNNVGARLSGTLSVVPVNGIASFGDLVVDKSASGFILQAAGAGALSKTSTPFTIFSP